MSAPKPMITEPTKPETKEAVHPVTSPSPATAPGVTRTAPQPGQAETKPAVKA